MKKVLFIAALAAGAGVTANAQKIDAAKVPAAVKKSFGKMHPNVTPKWENEKGEFEAGFKEDGKNMSVLFTKEGTMTESEVDIKVTALPVAVVSYVKDHYKGAPIKEAAKITKADGTINYEAEVHKMDVIFDSKGNFLKEMRD